MKLFRLIAIFLSLVAPAFGEEASVAFFTKGNEALASGDFRSAVEAYQEQIKTTGPDAALLFNLGNAHYRLGEYGPAILAYEQALVLDPHAEDIRTNLRLARDRATAFEESTPSIWGTPLFWLSLEEWMIAGLIALTILAVVSVAHGIAGEKIPRSPLRFLFVTSLAMLLLAAAALAIRSDELDRGIVVKADAKVRLSPFPTAEVVATLPAGRSVEIEKEHEGYYRIANGWIAKTDAAPVYALSEKID